MTTRSRLANSLHGTDGDLNLGLRCIVMDTVEDNGEWELADFLACFEGDVDAGTVHPLSHYLEVFPVHQDQVAAEYLARRKLVLDPSSATNPGFPSSYSRQVIGPYRLLRELGRGGQGVVWMAEDERLGRRVALKVLSEAGTQFPERNLERLRREAGIVARLDHPGLCSLLDLGTEGELTWICMRYVEGETLAARIAARRRTSVRSAIGQSSPEDVKASAATDPAGSELIPRLSRPEIDSLVALLEKAARALHVAHLARIVHRDIKPGNIMVTPSGDAVILDFGLAKETESDSLGLTRSTEILGTPPYMAPEQIRGQRNLDARTDIYALGVTLFEAVTLRRPFDAPTRDGLYAAIMNDTSPDPCQWNSAIRRDLKIVLDTALAKEPNHRYQSAEDFADDLKALLADCPISVRPISLIAKTWRWARREPAMASLAAVLLIATVAIASLITYVASTRGKVLQREAEEERDRIEAALEAGFAELGEGSEALAVRAFRRALEFEPGSIEARAGLALAALKSRRPDEALKVLDSAAGHWAGQVSLGWIRAQALRDAGRKDEAHQIEISPPGQNTPLDHFLLGSMELMEGHRTDKNDAFHRAVNHFTMAICTAPSARRLYHFELAHAAGHARDQEAADRAARSIIQLWPRTAESWRWVGVAFEGIDPARAREHYRYALQLNPVLAWPRYGLALMLHREGREEEALKELDHVLEQRPDFVEAHHFRGEIHQALGCHEEAMEDYRRAARCRPDAWMPLNNLGNLLFEFERTEEALVEFRRAVALRPTSQKAAELHLNFGKILAFIGNRSEAQEAFEAATRLSPECSEAWYELGRIHERAGGWSSALRAYQRVSAGSVGKTLEPLPVKERIVACKQAIDSAERARKILDGEVLATSPEEAVRLAEFLRLHGRIQDEARFWREATRSDPTLVDDLACGIRRHAARAASRAASSRGEGGPSSEEQAAWRSAALSWLQAEVAVLAQAFAQRRISAPRIDRILSEWEDDADLAALLKPGGLDRLPGSESQAWIRLWVQMKELRAQIE